jgi:hypothetical protein
MAAAALAALTLGAARPAGAQPHEGTAIQTDALGMPMVTRDFTQKTTTTVANRTTLLELVGAHYFVADGWRVGMSLEFAELLSKPGPGENRFVTFGVLPQVGWHFYGPFFTALLFGIFPRTSSGAHFDMSVQGVLGVSAPLATGVKLSFALEVPFRFYIHRTVGLTPLLGLSFEL